MHTLQNLIENHRNIRVYMTAHFHTCNRIEFFSNVYLSDIHTLVKNVVIKYTM